MPPSSPHATAPPGFSPIAKKRCSTPVVPAFHTAIRGPPYLSTLLYLPSPPHRR
uniref:Uncharacterized protein n=1 Tax=Cucumis melo TaxID=3656 RepID=A0A9I9D9G3_CUCME